jgi:hypothetical protein
MMTRKERGRGSLPPFYIWPRKTRPGTISDLFSMGADMTREVVLLQTLSRGRGSAKIGSVERGPLQ